MEEKQIKILAIETSCDETSAAVICGENYRPTANGQPPTIASNIVNSQIDLHAKTGGVVPEVASRAHMETMIPVIEEALFHANSKFEIRNSKQTQNSNFLKIKNSNFNSVSDFDISISDLLQDVTHLAVTAGPGLIGSLLVGFNTAKSLAYALDIPIIPINHIEGHIYSALAQNKITKNQETITKQINNIQYLISNEMEKISDGILDFKFPLLALTVSGGHTSLTLMHDHGKYQNVGATIDDAAGEAFDKVAKLLDLGYPGGPAISKNASIFRNRIINKQLSISNKVTEIKNTNFIARKEAILRQTQDKFYQKKITTPFTTGMAPACRQARRNENVPNSLQPNPYNLKFPRPMLDRDNYDFSFSGLKTAVLYEVKKLTANGQPLTADLKKQICYEFEEAVVDVLVTKTMRAAEKYSVKNIVVAGGVSANKYLRNQLTNKLQATSYKLILPPVELCGDNAAMIGLAAYYHIIRGDISSWDKIKVDSNLKL